MVKKLYLIVFIVTLLSSTANSLVFKFGYEPFLVKQFNPVTKEIRQSGAVTSSSSEQGEVNLLFHMVFLKLSNGWEMPYRNTTFRLEGGIASSIAPVRREWVIPPNFTGNLERPFSNSNSGPYWADRDINISNINQELYLIEETSLTKVPFQVKVNRSFSLSERFNLLAGVDAGISFYYFSKFTKKLEDILTATRFTSTKHSDAHFAKTFGLNLTLDYIINSRSNLFFDIDYNAVSGLSKIFLQGAPSLTRAEGYRLDGLRYNYKIGINWKI